MTLHSVALAGITAVVAVSVLAGCSALTTSGPDMSCPAITAHSAPASTGPAPTPTPEVSP